jgi:hypothetical protein
MYCARYVVDHLKGLDAMKKAKVSVPAGNWTLVISPCPDWGHEKKFHGPIPSFSPLSGYASPFQRTSFTTRWPLVPQTMGLLSMTSVRSLHCDFLASSGTVSNALRCYKLGKWNYVTQMNINHHSFKLLPVEKYSITNSELRTIDSRPSSS